jgi:hypothetical protein
MSGNRHTKAIMSVCTFLSDAVSGQTCYCFSPSVRLKQRPLFPFCTPRANSTAQFRRSIASGLPRAISRSGPVSVFQTNPFQPAEDHFGVPRLHRESSAGLPRPSARLHFRSSSSSGRSSRGSLAFARSEDRRTEAVLSLPRICPNNC